MICLDPAINWEKKNKAEQQVKRKGGRSLLRVLITKTASTIVETP